jgi:hypothetical protein
MDAKHVWGMVLVGGMVGALLTTGAAVASNAGGLPACQAKLETCQADLGTCQTELAACPTFPGDGVDGPALSYHDNGDGTFTDNNTLFMWEVKLAADGSAGGNCNDATQSKRSVHCVNNVYSQGGTLFTVFLATLNTNPCFAGHCDWRLPNVKELQSIMDYSKIDPTASVPGSTAAGLYWSSTSFAGNSSVAWHVDFFDGFVNFDDKNFALLVRAVRGGR